LPSLAPQMPGGRLWLTWLTRSRVAALGLALTRKSGFGWNDTERQTYEDQHMALLKIARMGNPVLSQVAEPIEDPTAPEVAQLVADMIETMEDANGTGLAAPQVHVSKRIVVFYVDEGRDEREGGEEAGVPLTVLINPEIEPLSQEKDTGWEGCLSIPAMMGEVPRFTHIRYWAYDLEGNRFEREAHGFHARVVQHECDHLDGRLYPGRIEDMQTFGFSDELMRRPNLDPNLDDE